MKDAAGKPFFREMLDTAAHADSGRVEYRWLNRIDKREEPKVTLFRKVGERIIAVGYYVPRATPAQARELLDRAVAAVKEKGAAAIAAFNAIDGGYIQDDLYVFAIDVNTQRFLAHGATPQMVGSDVRLLRDPKRQGDRCGHAQHRRPQGRGRTRIRLAQSRPDKVETKHSFLRKVGDTLVGVGYYAR